MTITDVNEKGLIETSKDLILVYVNLDRMVYDATGSDSSIIHVICDVSDLESVKQSARIAKDKFGPVTLLINNAGIVSGKSILELSDVMMKKTLEINTLSHLYTIR